MCGLLLTVSKNIPSSSLTCCFFHPFFFSVPLLSFTLLPLFLHQRVSLEFYIDVHAHSTMLNGFMYGNVFEDEERVQRQAVFPRLLCQNAPDFSFVSHVNRCKANTPDRRWGSGAGCHQRLKELASPISATAGEKVFRLPTAVLFSDTKPWFHWASLGCKCM